MQGRKSLIHLVSVVIVITALVVKLPIATGNPPHQDNLQVITAENVARLTQLERWGRGFVMDAAFAPDNQILAIQSTIGIWVYVPESPYSFQEPYLLENEHGGVSSMIFHPTENTLVAGNRDGTLSFWDVAARTELKTIEAHRNAVTLLAFTPDGAILASADTWVFDETRGLDVNGKIKLWDWATGNLISTVLSHHDDGERLTPLQLAFTPDGSVLATYFANFCSDAPPQSFEFFDVQTGQPIVGIELGYPEKWSNAITFDLNGKTVLMSNFLGYHPGHPTVIEWGESRQQQLNQIIGDAAAETRFDIMGSLDGKHLLIDFSGKDDLVVWNFDENTFRAKISAPPYSDAFFSPNGQKLVLTTSNGFTYYDVSDQSVTEDKYADFPVFASKLLFSADGTRLGTLNVQGIRIWNTVNWREITSYDAPEVTDFGTGIIDFDFSPDGKQILFGDNEANLSIWDIVNGAVLSFPSAEYKYQVEPIRSVAFNPDPSAEHIFASGSENGLALWKKATGSTYEIALHYGQGYDIAFSHDGKLIASVGLYDGVFIEETSLVIQGRLPLDSSSGVGLVQNEAETPSRPLQSSGEVETPITTVAFSPDSTIIATGAGSSFYCYRAGNVQVWRVPDVELLATLEDHTEEVTAVVFSPDGSLLASSSEDGTIHIRRSDTYEILAVLEGHLGYGVNSIAFTPDGRLLISAGDDGTIRLWGIPE
ncbi:MAG: hypothetical protein DPW16_17590 [Chloroflexi bacterium]|nr:hypothetical protein [Chloroflexota bacterium]